MIVTLVSVKQVAKIPPCFVYSLYISNLYFKCVFLLLNDLLGLTIDNGISSASASSAINSSSSSSTSGTRSNSGSINVSITNIDR